MANRNLGRDILNKVKNKTGKTVSQQDIQRLASNVNSSTMQDEAQLRKLIKQVASVAKVPVSEATINDIVKTVKKSGMNPNNMQQLMNMMLGKK